MCRVRVVAGMALLVLVLAACAPGPNVLTDVPDKEGETAGFWVGIWHRSASPMAFVLSLSSESVVAYEVHNAGGWYNFGFLLGASILFGNSGGSACSGNRRRRKDWGQRSTVSRPARCAAPRSLHVRER